MRNAGLAGELPHLAEERHEVYDVLSTNSPLGQALMGARPGETVSYDGPRRTFQVEVVGVRPAGLSR